MKKAGDEIQWQGDLIAVRGRRNRRGRGRRAQGRSRSSTSRSTSSSTRKTWKPPRPPAHRQGRRQGAAREGARRRRRRGRVRREGDRAAVQGSRPPWSKATTASTPSRTCAWSRTARPASGRTASSRPTSRRKTSRARPASSPRRWSITADDVTVHCDYIGGGFGSKFAADRWGVAGRQDRQGTRPPGQADARPRPGAEERRLPPLGLRRRRRSAPTRRAWSPSGIRTTGGPAASAAAALPQDVMPYVFVPPNSSPQGDQRQDQHRAAAGLAGAEPSARPVR